MLTHAYAVLASDARPDYYVVLTDGPIPPEMVAKDLQRNGRTLLQSGKLSGISMLLNAEGFLLNIIPFIGDIRGTLMLGSAGSLTSFVVGAKAVTGQGTMDTKTTGQGWSYSAGWNATLLTTK